MNENDTAVRAISAFELLLLVYSRCKRVKGYVSVV